MAFKRDDNKAYIMPISFGPTASRYPEIDTKYHMPSDLETISITYETDGEFLETLIPECFTLNAPYVTVIQCQLRNQAHMGGKSYNLMNVNVPVHFKGERDDLDGDFILVMFENHSDPIVAGREEMGYSKIYSDIPDFERLGSRYIAKASNWDFRFMKMEVDVSKDIPDLETLKEIEGRSSGKVHYKYFPHTMEKGEDPAFNYTKPAVEYPTIVPKWVKPDDYPYELYTPKVEYGDGKIEFYEPKWEDIPLFHQVHIGLSKLTCKRVIGAKHVIFNDPCDYSTCYRLR